MVAQTMGERPPSTSVQLQPIAAAAIAAAGGVGADRC